MSKRKALLSVVTSLILAMSLMLVGCGGGGGAAPAGDTGADSSGAEAAEIITVTPGALTIGSDCDYPPFIEMQGEQAAGFEYDLLMAIAGELGLELVYLPPQAFDTIIASVASGMTMDIGASSFTINDERLEQVDFSIPYFDSNQAAVARAESGFSSAMDLNGKVVGAQAGTTGADWIRENLSDPGTVLKEYTQASEMMNALVGGGIDGAVFDDATASSLVATQFTDAEVVEIVPTGEQYGFAISKDNPGLLEGVNNAMKTLKENGTFDQIFLKYFPELTPPSLGVDG